MINPWKKVKQRKACKGACGWEAASDWTLRTGLPGMLRKTPVLIQRITFQLWTQQALKAEINSAYLPNRKEANMGSTQRDEE